MRTRPGRVEPEVYFRIDHVAGDGHHDTPVGAYREQTVEIALRPKGAFENGNIGDLMLRAPPSQVVSSVPPGRCNPKPAREPKPPRVVELLRKAIEWRRQIDAGEVRNQAEIARQEEITRARVTKIMGMLRLAPEIQEQILSLPDSARRFAVTERILRRIGTIPDYRVQLLGYDKLFNS